MSKRSCAKLHKSVIQIAAVDRQQLRIHLVTLWLALKLQDVDRRSLSFPGYQIELVSRVPWLEKNWFAIHKGTRYPEGWVHSCRIFVFAGDTGKSQTVYSQPLRAMPFRSIKATVKPPLGVVICLARPMSWPAGFTSIQFGPMPLASKQDSSVRTQPQARLVKI